MTEPLLARHAQSARVAYGGRGERSARDLLCDAGAVAHALPERRADKPLALLGVRRDPYDSVAALLGAWARGYEVLVPPADCTREGFLSLAQRAEVGAVIHDTASTAALPIERILAAAVPERSLLDARHVPAGVLRLVLPALDSVRVSGEQLLREAALIGRGLTLPQHAAYACSLLLCSRYAWAVGVFWPLMSGGALQRGDARDPRWAEGFAGERPVLCAAPAQIRALSQQLWQVQRVVSIGAPLAAAAFERLQAFDVSVSDVYACQHLGSLGARSTADDAFQPLPEVTIEGESVSAPHLTDVGRARIETSRSTAGGFIATGVGSERAHWEERIAWLDGVHDAALIALPDGEPAKQSWYVALSMEPDTNEATLRRRIFELLPELPIAGFCSLQRQEPAAAASLASFATNRCDLTRNGAGRHDRSSLLRLFGRDADSAPLSWTLTQLSERAEGERYVREVQIPERFGFFVGHFPGYPILPGAAQLSELVVPFVRSVRPQLGRLVRMARLKFQERIVPGDIVQVTLQLSAAAEGSVDFTLRRGDSVCASGRLVFAASEPQA